MAAPFAVFVQFEVAPGKEEEFNKIMEIDATETRKEPANLRFDLLKVQGSERKYCLYEVYKDEAGVDAHVKTDHYKMWNEFKSKGQGLVEGSYTKILMDVPNLQI
mmetsp:Transcript_4962/g.13966  ORF Transcript_4962/g.13966 Transcript_4962/m.13966 type:complete len:105 (+) Transcript_4962:92-406(+)|eukprot:CAMPEP_0179371114 /NCGR_PEP_ID=MMETSP0797-20121207/85541_1 /TAXON_ID=47934 /ORGANISM="Dinophysis acuminata, Strain DAEP01" /LENGTH=104 /DNA_ID=CAMNT_0021086921 /DNA_START=114 /DNA_END=428 /DNA_ORIENTATION=-